MKIMSYLFISLILILANSKLLVDQQLNLPIDEDNYIRVFHGMNVSFKKPPYFPPIKDSFDFSNSFSREDTKLFKQWGFNVIRLSFFWEGVEPKKGEYSQDYLNEMKRIIEICAENDIYVLLDLHQDAANRQFCGEGMPDWAVEKKKFPHPLLFKFDYDQDGYPTYESCQKRIFGIYYMTEGVQTAFQNLYDNKNGIQDTFSRMWQKVASETKNYKNLFGYELINEPFIGNIFEKPSRLIDGGMTNMHPFYTNVIKKINEVDQENLILFEVSNSLEAEHIVPGEAKDKKRIMHSYHIYCGGKTDPKYDYICDKDYSKADNHYISLRKKWGGLSSFLTEFGAIPGHPGADISTTDFLLNLTEEKFNSWAYWQYKYYEDYTTAARPQEAEGLWDGKGNIIQPKLDLLVRPYAYKICGTPIEHIYKHNYQFRMKAGRKCKEQKTFFYIHKSNIDYTVKNCKDCVFYKTSNNYYVLEHSQAREGDIIELIVEWKTKNNRKNIN